MTKNNRRVLQAAVLALSFCLTGCFERSNTELFEDGLVSVKGGTFTMGNEKVTGKYAYQHQVHQVTVGNFYMAPAEVTQAEFYEIMGYNPSYHNGSDSGRMPVEGEVQDQRPVEHISWYEALIYCNLLSRKNRLKPCYSMEINGKNVTDTSKWGEIPEKGSPQWDSIKWNDQANGYRLPTEAEWEYASRGGSMSAGYSSSGTDFDSSELGQFSWYDQNSKGRTHQVKLLTPNELGLYDMCGNVYEWCWDWFSKNYYTSPEAMENNPKGPQSGEYRVVRGAEWSSDYTMTASYVRGSASPHLPSRRQGFRICRTDFTESKK